MFKNLLKGDTKSLDLVIQHPTNFQFEQQRWIQDTVCTLQLQR